MFWTPPSDSKSNVMGFVGHMLEDSHSSGYESWNEQYVFKYA